MPDPRQVVEKAIQAARNRDLSEATVALIHPEITVTYPQSGEVIHGRDNYIAMLRNYPGLPAAEISEPHGERQHVHVSTPMPFSIPSVTITGSGNTFFVESVNTYPDGSVYHVASIIKVGDDRIIEEVSYFAAPFDPPEWRKAFVEPAAPRYVE